ARTAPSMPVRPDYSAQRDEPRGGLLDQRPAVAADAALELRGGRAAAPGTAARAAGAIAALLAILFGPGDALARPGDFALGRVDSKDLDLDLVSDFHDLFGVLDLVVGKFRNV